MAVCGRRNQSMVNSAPPVTSAHAHANVTRSTWLAAACFRTFVSHRRTEVPNRPSFPLVKGGLLNKQQGHSLGLQVGVYKPEPLFEQFYVI